MGRHPTRLLREPDMPTLDWHRDEHGRATAKVGHNVWYRIVYVERHWEAEFKIGDGPWHVVENAPVRIKTGARVWYSEHAAKLGVENLPFPKSRRG